MPYESFESVRFGLISYSNLSSFLDLIFSLFVSIALCWQGLTGIDAATLTASAVSISTLKTTIAGTMGLTADSIGTITVEDYITRRQLSLSSLLHPLASTSVVTMTYVVSATSVYSADNLYWRLNGAVYSGAFNTDLYTNAQATGATVLYGCTSMVVSTTIDWDFDDDNIGKLNGGAIAGIVIGVLAFVAIVGGLIFYFACRRRRKFYFRIFHFLLRFFRRLILSPISFLFFISSLSSLFIVFFL